MSRALTFKERLGLSIEENAKLIERTAALELQRNNVMKLNESLKAENATLAQRLQELRVDNDRLEQRAKLAEDWHAVAVALAGRRA